MKKIFKIHRYTHPETGEKFRLLTMGWTGDVGAYILTKTNLVTSYEFHRDVGHETPGSYNDCQYVKSGHCSTHTDHLMDPRLGSKEALEFEELYKTKQFKKLFVQMQKRYLATFYARENYSPST